MVEKKQNVQHPERRRYLLYQKQQRLMQPKHSIPIKKKLYKMKSDVKIVKIFSENIQIIFE